MAHNFIYDQDHSDNLEIVTSKSLSSYFRVRFELRMLCAELIALRGDQVTGIEYTNDVVC